MPRNSVFNLVWRYDPSVREYDGRGSADSEDLDTVRTQMTGEGVQSTPDVTGGLTLYLILPTPLWSAIPAAPARAAECTLASRCNRR